MLKFNTSQKSGFTIVELLVVIVVIGILAAMTLISYNSIAKQAVVASIKSDLSSASRQISMFYTDKGYYPTSISCPATADTICLKPSQSNVFSDYTSTTNPVAYSLRSTSADIIFVVTNNSPPTEVAPLTAIAAISGTVQVGSAVTVGTLTPTGATGSYQWQKADTSNGTYANISGATSNTYTPIVADSGKYLRVVATGTGSYYSSVNSAAVRVPPVPVAVIVNSSFTNSEWGATFDYNANDEICVSNGNATTTAAFNLSSYPSANGSFTAASVSWSRTNFWLGGGGPLKYLKRDDTKVVLQSWDITVDATSMSNAALLTFINAKRGTTATLFWDSQNGDCSWGDTSGVQVGMSAPKLTLTWQEN